MDKYKGNSNNIKHGTTGDDIKKIDKVVSGKVKTKKKSEVSKMANVFLADDVSNVKDYVIMDVIVPAAKKAISDIITNGIDMLLYGETGRSKKTTGASKVSYRSYYDRDERDRLESRQIRRGVMDYDDIILENRTEAEQVLSSMDDIIDRYGIASVADLYELVGITAQHTDNKYGWTDVRNASVIRCRDGFMLKFPRTKPI